MFYNVGLIGTKERDIVEAETPELACYAAGWAPSACEVVDITDQIIALRDHGELKVVNGPRL